MTDLNAASVPALKLLAKQKGLKGYSDLPKQKLIELINGSPTAPNAPVPAAVTESVGQTKSSGVDLSDGKDPAKTDGLEIPPGLKRTTTPEDKTKIDKALQDRREGKRDWVMPKTSALAQKAAKQQGMRRTAAEKLWAAKDQKKDFAHLPKQAQVIVKVLREQAGPTPFPVLAEKCAKELKTKQPPHRILQFYHGKLIQEGFLHVTVNEKK